MCIALASNMPGRAAFGVGRLKMVLYTGFRQFAGAIVAKEYVTTIKANIIKIGLQ